MAGDHRRRREELSRQEPQITQIAQILTGEGPGQHLRNLRNLRLLCRAGGAMEQTRRQEIRALLGEREWTLDELAARYLLPKRVIVDDLEHIARSVAPRQRLTIVAPVCDACGFRFRDRTRFSDPSRCPRCKNEHLRPQRLRIA